MSRAAGVAHAVRGDEREAERAGEVDERAVALLLVAEAVALQLDVEAAREDAPELVEKLPRRVGAVRPRAARGDRPLVAAGQAGEPLGVLRRLLPA